MADSDYLKMLGMTTPEKTASNPLANGISLMTLQNSLNKQETPDEVQASSLQGMARDLGNQPSFGGSFVKGFLSGTAAGKMSKAAQARQSQNDKLQTLMDYYQKQIENANQIENQARITQVSNQELMGVMPQVATAAQEAYQTGDPTKLTQLVKSLPMTNQRFNNMEHAPDGASFNTFTRIGDGENMAFHAVYDMPDGSKFMSPVGITQTALNANVLAPMQNELAKRQFAMNGLQQEQNLKQAQIAQANAGAAKDQATADMSKMFSPQEGSINQGQPSTGADYLKSIAPQAQGIVKGIAEGRTPVSPMMFRTPQGMALLSAVQQYDPSFDASNYQARLGLRKDFTSGETSKNIVALNTGMSHLGVMADMAQGLDNGSLTPVNYVKNVASRVLGSAAPQDYQTAKTAVAHELGKLFKGSGVLNEQEVTEWEKAFNQANSPQQFDGVIHTALNLVNGRMEALQDKWHKGMGPNTEDFPLLDKHATDVLNRFGFSKNTEGGVSQNTVQSLPQGAVHVISVKNADADYAALPKGAQFMAPDGKIRIKQ